MIVGVDERGMRFIAGTLPYRRSHRREIASIAVVLFQGTLWHGWM